MPKILRRAALIAGLVAAPLAAAAQDATPLETYDASAVLATVGGVDITLGDVIAARQSLPPQVQALPDDQLYEGLLEQIVQESLFAGAAADAGLDARADVVRRIETARRQILAEAYVAQSIEPQLTDEALKARYDADVASAPQEEEIRARHILVEEEAKAAELKAQLDGGADFEALAKEHSTGPSGPGGGDLGFFRKGMMVPEFETAAFELAAGEVSGPVQTSFGWHLIKVEERRAVTPPSFDSMRDELRQTLAREIAQGEIAALRADGGVVSAEQIPPASAVREDALLEAE